MNIPGNRLALLVLILTVLAGTTFLVVNRKATTTLQAPPTQATPGLQLEIPDAPWEPIFFEELEQRTQVIGLSSLRTTLLPEHDVEVRFWYDRFQIISGVVIRRNGQDWSASWIQQMQDHQPSSVRQVKLNPPKSGWEALWNSLLGAGILTVKDSSQADCPAEALDGIGYIVETNVDRKYRTYWYGNPQLMRCSEAKQMLRLEEIIAQEFSLRDFNR